MRCHTSVRLSCPVVPLCQAVHHARLLCRHLGWLVCRGLPRLDQLCAASCVWHADGKSWKRTRHLGRDYVMTSVLSCLFSTSSFSLHPLHARSLSAPLYVLSLLSTIFPHLSIRHSLHLFFYLLHKSEMCSPSYSVRSKRLPSSACVTVFNILLSLYNVLFF